ncbi:MAG: signal recognition particle-docking protein FtsY [Desulfatiglandaceae bacterium]
MARFFKRKKKESTEEENGPEGLAPETASEVEPQPPEGAKAGENGLFKRLSRGLSKTRSTLTGRMGQLLLGKKEITQELLDDLEEILFTSDIGVATTQELIDYVQEKVARKELQDPEKLLAALRERIQQFLDLPPADHVSPNPGEPRVIMVVGVNGVGKTTTIAKAANHFKSEGKAVMLVAADTFRAAAVEQLSIWGERVGAEVVKQKTGADPSAVAFDALSAAVARKMDVVLVDTAGRLHTQVNLMEELQKIHRVIGQKLRGAPHEVWLVLDATTGQNAISQAELFNNALTVTDIILTKLDGTAKGGIVVGISRQLGIPIRFIGIGEKMDDLRPFHPQEFVEAIFGSPFDG